MGGEFIGVSKGAEQAIPPRDISIIERVEVQFVMNRMMFRPLDEIPEPMGSAKVAVVEIFSQNREDIEPGSRHRRGAEENEQDCARQPGIG